MKIKVEENLFIESDGIQFIIKKYNGKLDKHDVKIFTALGYYGSLNSAIKSLVKMKVMQSEATTVNELLGDLIRIEKEIDDLINI